MRPEWRSNLVAGLCRPSDRASVLRDAALALTDQLYASADAAQFAGTLRGGIIALVRAISVPRGRG
jgi:hypothetical protein